MRIKSVTVRKYRIHREFAVDLDDSRTLIGGPNECGKSTLVEAIHRAFFLKAKGNTENHRAMHSSVHGGNPEVEVQFKAGGADYHLKKRFGSSGTTTLTSSTSTPLSGEAAEIELARILGVDAGLTGRAATGQWSHLWIWQRCSGDDPLAHADAQQSNLLRRLQDSGGAAALASDLDSRVAKTFAEAADATFTQSGKPKAGSELQSAESAAESARESHRIASERLQRSLQLVRDFEDATQAIARATTELGDLNRQKDVAESTLSNIGDLRRKEAIQHPKASTAAAQHEALKNADTQISNLRLEIENLTKALEPGNAETGNLAEGLENSRKHSTEAGKAYDQACSHTRETRLRRDLATSCVARFEKEERLQELLLKDEKVRGHRDDLNRLREEVAKLPSVTAPVLKKIQKLEAAAKESEAALSAMAAGIEVLLSDEPVWVGDMSLSSGQSQIVTEQTDIVVGDSLRLRISPGGGSSLQEARSRAKESVQELGEALDGLGIATASDAAECLALRNDLSGKIGNIEKTLEDLDAESLQASLAAAREASAAAEAEVERRSAQVAEMALPATAAEARQVVAGEDGNVQQAESAEVQAKSVRDAAAHSAAEAEKALSLHRQTLDQKNADLTGLKAQMRLLIETHGDDEVRVKALAEALLARSTAEADLDATRKSLADLQPELIESEHLRLKRAIDQAAASKRDAETKRAVAQAGLRSEGTEDPEAALALAAAHAQSLEEYLDSVRRKAEAIRLLDQLFVDEQRALSKRFTEPFAERISAYLQCLFGSGARAMVTLDDDGFSGLQLVRPTQDRGAIAFETLSGGAQEQVAAAVRLAMAEVLAPDHDGCLPLVFDDAFAYSDPNRVQILQRMLDLAASRGLQVIVLTCDPSDYAALGAAQVSLRVEAVAAGSPVGDFASSSVMDVEDGDTSDRADLTDSPGVAVPLNEDHCEQLLSALGDNGGKAGNRSLRQLLGWDETSYDAIKSHLVDSGRLVPGRGRGGSVALP